MQNALQEEFKPFAMALEFLSRRKPKWRVVLKDVLFNEGDISEARRGSRRGREKRLGRLSSLSPTISAGAAANAEVVISMLIDAKAVRDAYLGENGAAKAAGDLDLTEIATVYEK